LLYNMSESAGDRPAASATRANAQGPGGVFAPVKLDELFAALDGLDLKTA
jgi:hypothetical protein